VILVDTSAWVEFLRGTGSAVCEEVDRLVGERIAVTDPIVMEVLAGARDDAHLHQLRGLLGRAEMARCEPVDYPAAAVLCRGCRQRGETVRRLVNCLTGAVAIRNDLSVLHNDADFEVLARHTGLKVHTPAR
jgi:predicted nucleic acid-binding protein